MKYPNLLTIKSTKEINSLAASLAKAAGRNRSEYIRDLIRLLSVDQNLRKLVNNAIDGNR